MATSSMITLPLNDKSHHLSATHFHNPWPSSRTLPGSAVFQARFLRKDKNYVPIPTSREELVKVRPATFGHDDPTSAEKLKATWIGHASWLIEYPSLAAGKRGVTFLLDPVFSERTSPVSFLGPKRYSPLPCQLADLPPVDAVCISHSHYDHLDIDVISWLNKNSPRTVYIVPLRLKAWFISAVGVPAERVTECDWWDAVRVEVPGVGATTVVCTPSQHGSARTPFDRDQTLWSSWAIGAAPTEDTNSATTPATSTNSLATTSTLSKTKISSDIPQVTPLSSPSVPFSRPRLYFAGDTAYRSVPSNNPTPEELANSPTCPAFAQMGQSLGPFDLALLPMGLYSPRDLLSLVHCSPEDAVEVHQVIKSKKSVGMHWGTFRGGLSQYYEDVREPPRRFERVAREAGLEWGKEIGLCEIGETVIV